MSLHKKILFTYLLVLPVLLFGQADFTTSVTSGCTPLSVKFSIDNTTLSLDTVQEIRWYFGFGDTLVANDPDTIIYENAGIYTASLIIVGDNGRSITEKPSLIEVDQTQPAQFSISEVKYRETYQCIPTAAIIDNSLNYYYNWRFTNINTGKSSVNSMYLTSGNKNDAIATVDLQNDLNATEEDSLFLFNLIIDNPNGCLDNYSQERIIPYNYQAVNSADFHYNVTSGCTPLKLKFSLDSNTISLDTVQEIRWYFGFGDTLVANDPDTVVYEDGGNYTVRLIVEGDNGITRTTKTDLITANQSQPADFAITHLVYGEEYECIPVDAIIDKTKLYTYNWRLNNDSSIYTESITVTSGDKDDAAITVNLQDDLGLTSDEAVIQVKLAVDDADGCSSTFSDEIVIQPGVQVANVFSVASTEFFTIIPSENRSLNDEGGFDVVLSFEVFSRWGTLVYRETAPTINWDGRTTNGQEVGTGVYFYVLKAVTPDEDGRYSKQGFIHLFR